MTDRSRAKGAVARTNVTPAASAFVGRTGELELLRQWLDAGRRLITIAGPPGAGKTRLARELSTGRHASGARPAGGVFMADLSAVATEVELADAVARVLGIPLTVDEAAGGTVDQAIVALALRGQVLVVLDNFEQLVAGCAETVARMLERAPEAQLVVTSRERLRVDGEQLLTLGSLSLPAGDAGPDAVAASEAGRLFVDRVRAARPDYAADAEEAGRIARIVTLLDGLPLPIELAAARLPVLGSRALLQRLETGAVALLARGTRDAAGRQASLEAAIAWSWEMLEPEERSALSRCSVFRGSFAVEAGEAVAGGARALDVLQSLHEKSLLDSIDAGGGAVRFRLLMGIREYAAARLDESGERAAAESALRRHLAAFVRPLREEAERYGRPDPTARLSAERDDLRAIAARLREPDAAAAEDELECVLALDALLAVHGPVPQHRALLERAAVAFRDDPIAAARIAVARGRLELAVGRDAEALEAYRRASALLAGGGPTELRIAATTGLVRALVRCGQLGSDGADAAIAAAESAVAALGDPLGEARTLGARAMLDLARGDAASAAAMARRAIERAGSIDSVPDEAQARVLLVRALLCGADSPSAIEEARAAVEVAGRAVDPRRLGDALVASAFAAADRGDPGARAVASRAVAYTAEIGDRKLSSRALVARALVHLDRDEPARARERADQALALVSAAGDARGIPLEQAEARLAIGLAAWLAGDGDGARAAFLRAAEGAEGADVLFAATARALATAAGADVEPTTSGRGASRGAAPGDGASGGAAPEWPAGVVASGIAEVGRAFSARGKRMAKATERLRAIAAGPTSLAARSLPVRLAVRALSASLPPADRDALRIELADPTGEALVAAIDGRFFRAPDGDVVDLSGKQKLALLLRCLVARRRGEGAPAAGLEEVLAEVWPGEKMLPEAASNRVYATVALLRKAGLGRLVENGPEGYWIDRSVRVLVLP